MQRSSKDHSMANLTLCPDISAREANTLRLNASTPGRLANESKIEQGSPRSSFRPQVLNQRARPVEVSATCVENHPLKYGFSSQVFIHPLTTTDELWGNDLFSLPSWPASNGISDRTQSLHDGTRNNLEQFRHASASNRRCSTDARTVSTLNSSSTATKSLDDTSSFDSQYAWDGSPATAPSEYVASSGSSDVSGENPLPRDPQNSEATWHSPEMYWTPPNITTQHQGFSPWKNTAGRDAREFPQVDHPHLLIMNQQPVSWAYAQSEQLMWDYSALRHDVSAAADCQTHGASNVPPGIDPSKIQIYPQIARGVPVKPFSFQKSQATDIPFSTVLVEPTFDSATRHFQSSSPVTTDSQPNDDSVDSDQSETEETTHNRSCKSSVKRKVRANSRGSNRRSHDKDDFLVKSKLAGMSYKEIRAKGNFSEAESTLRGRFRALTKEKHRRVRKPTWHNNDIFLLQQAVNHFKSPSTTSSQPHVMHSSKTKGKVPWMKVADYIEKHGGSYHFGSATCRRKWEEITKQG